MNEIAEHKNEGRKIVAGIVLLLVTQFASLIIARYVSHNYATVFIFSRILLWVSFFLVLVYAYTIEKKRLLIWKENNPRFSFFLLSVLAILGLIYVGSVILTLIFTKWLHFPARSARFEQLIPMFKKNKWLCFATALTAGITEELLFRGYLMPRLQLFFKSNWLPVIISTLLFALLHFSYGTFMQIIGPFYIGLIFALYYQKYRNIKVLILCHFLWDIMILAALVVHK